MIEWQPLATVGAALLVLIGAGITIRQRDRSDRKDQWWKRTQWALDLTLHPDDFASELGYAGLAEQARSRLADAEDLRFLSVALAAGVDNGPLTVDTGPEAEEH